MPAALDTVHQGDCLETLARFDAESVDLAFADPPFNIGYKYDVYDDRRAAEDYLNWSRDWITAVRRVLKPDGTFWLAIGDEFAAELKVLATRELGFHCRSWVVWFYTFGVHCKHKFTRSHAHLFYFVMDPKKFTFNSMATRVPSARELVYGDKRADPAGRVPDDTWMMAPCLPPEVPTRDGFILRPQDIPDRFPPDSDTWFYSRVAGTFKERSGFHGCQMPEQLLGRIIRACSNDGDLVLDPFGGSGTTLAVAKKLGRRFVGCELSEEYAAGIERRLASINPGDKLDGPEDAVRSAPTTKKGRRLDRGVPSRPMRSASKSPVIARANVSLGQVAVANGEYATAVAEAFMAAHDGYSADRVLADPALNDRFLDSCRLLGLPGEPRDWNHLLLNVRKQGRLAAIDTSRRTVIRRKAMAPYLFASEMAWRQVGLRENCSLDELLCDPQRASYFDQVARNIGPSYSSFEYRWAALAIRKDASQGRRLQQELEGASLRRLVRASESNRLSSSPGHYLISAAGKHFYVGYSDSLRSCRLFEAERLEVALAEMDFPVRSTRDVEIRTRIFDRSALQPRGEPVEWQAALRARLLQKYEPIANALLPASVA